MLDTNAIGRGCMKTGFDNIVIHRILRCSVNKYTKLTNNYTWYDFHQIFSSNSLSYRVTTDVIII